MRVSFTGQLMCVPNPYLFLPAEWMCQWIDVRQASFIWDHVCGFPSSGWFLNYLQIGDEHQFSNPQKLLFISRCVKKLWKATDMFVMSICTEKLGTHWLDFEWNLSIFKKSVKKFSFHWSLTRITGSLHEDQWTFEIAARWNLLRMSSVSDKLMEKIRTHIPC